MIRYATKLQPAETGRNQPATGRVGCFGCGCNLQPGVFRPGCVGCTPGTPVMDEWEMAKTPPPHSQPGPIFPLYLPTARARPRRVSAVKPRKSTCSCRKSWFLPGHLTLGDAEARDWPSLRAKIVVARPPGCQPLPVPVDRMASGTGTTSRASLGRASAPWRQGEHLLLPGISAAFSAAPRWRP